MNLALYPETTMKYVMYFVFHQLILFSVKKNTWAFYTIILTTDASKYCNIYVKKNLFSTVLGLSILA